MSRVHTDDATIGRFGSSDQVEKSLVVQGVALQQQALQGTGGEQIVLQGPDAVVVQLEPLQRLEGQDRQFSEFVVVEEQLAQVLETRERRDEYQLISVQPELAQMRHGLDAVHVGEAVAECFDGVHAQRLDGWQCGQFRV